MIDIGKNIKLLRQQQNLTQDALAEALFVTRQTISNWENGVSRPDVEMLLALAQALNTDANTVLYGPPELLARQKELRRFALQAALFGVALLAYALLYPYAVKVSHRFFLMWAYGMRVGVLPLLWFWGGCLLMQALQLWAGLKPLAAPRLRTLLKAVLALLALLIVPTLLFYLIGTLMAIGKSSVSLSFPMIPVYTHLSGILFRIAYTMPYLWGLLGIGWWLSGGKEA